MNIRSLNKERASGKLSSVAAEFWRCHSFASFLRFMIRLIDPARALAKEQRTNKFTQRMAKADERSRAICCDFLKWFYKVTSRHFVCSCTVYLFRHLTKRFLASRLYVSSWYVLVCSWLFNVVLESQSLETTVGLSDVTNHTADLAKPFYGRCRKK